MTTSSKRAEITITPRKVDFDFSDVPEKWLSTIEASHFMNALSVTIPVTERFVIENLRKSLNRVENPQLREELLGVIKQEGMHARFHKKVNQFLSEGGFTRIPLLERIHSFGFDWVQKLMPQSFVDSIPAAMEHFTANISKSVLKDHSLWFDEGADNDAVRFLKWHALEELEHQAVCFDLYKELGHKSFFFSLSLVVLWMPLTALYIYGIHLYLLLKTRRLRGLNRWRKYVSFTGKTLPLFFSGAWKYCRKDYTPWTLEDSHLFECNNKPPN